MTSAAAITIKNLCLAYQQDWLFYNFNAQFTLNKWSCLLGTSGIGKSSLLRAIAGLTRTEHGHLSGSIKFASPLGAQPTTLMAQNDALLPWLTVRDNILLGYHLRHEEITTSLQIQADKILTQIGLAQVAQHYPHTLSGGMRQRIALARTLIEDQSIILMDEPFAAIDRITRQSLHQCVRNNLQQKTVLFVTHDPLEALALSDTIYIMFGSPVQLKCVYQRHHNLSTQLDQSAQLQHYSSLCDLLSSIQSEHHLC